MSLIENFKEVADLVKKMGEMDLHRKIIDLQDEIVKLSRENRTLKEQLELKGKMIFKRNCYWVEGDDVPYCPRCWEDKAKTIHLRRDLVDTGDEKVLKYDCPRCGNSVFPEDQAESSDLRGLHMSG